MRARLPLLTILLASAAAPAAAQTTYRIPAPEIVQVLDAPPTPSAHVSPDARWLLLAEPAALPSIAELARPMLRLAGERIDPATNGPARPPRSIGLLLQELPGGAERRVTLPAEPALSNLMWSPNSRRFAFTQTRADGIELWLGDVATASTRRVSAARLNAAAGSPCRWLPDSTGLLCLLVPESRGAAPAEPQVPVGPVAQETHRTEAAVWTFQDLLEDMHDERLFEYYFTAQLARIDAGSGLIAKLGSPALIERIAPSPDGAYLLVVSTTRPFSYFVPSERFPKRIEIWDAQGELVHRLAELPLAEQIPRRGVRTGPRSIDWRPTESATLVWAEALDGGNPRSQAEHRDRVLQLRAPFQEAPRAVLRTRDRFAGVEWAEHGIALVTERDARRRWERTVILDFDSPDRAARVLWDRSSEDRYGDPGDPVLRRTARGAVLLQDGDWIYTTGDGASPEGNRPFLDRINLRTLHTERLWRASPTHYETVVVLVDAGARRIVTRRESTQEPPNYFLRELGAQPRALTHYAPPAPRLAQVRQQLVRYQRADGLALSGTLYLPPDYQAGTRVPTVLWAYPREFVSPDAAGQVSAAPNRFFWPRGASHLFFLLQGYAVFDNPTMPIVGGDTANNRYVEQLVASARAAVDKLVDIGVADRHRIGVGGHSYGAFMTANLLAHSDLFRAGIARSGAYNRTLTPFGFQNEDRTYWEAADVYTHMSPFMNAQHINEPILLTHGEADNNSGTFPIQSERLYHALKGLGGHARFVLLPHESHGYAARESVLHTIAEMLEWFDRHVKNATAREIAS